MMKEKELFNLTTKGFAAIAGSFVVDSLQKMIPWLIVMFAVVICDLITGCRKSMLFGEKVRFSRAWRATMGKMVTYFSFVIMVVLINKASGEKYNIDTWSVLLICFIEGSSIISNILRPKGYDINVAIMFGILLKKIFNIEKEDSKELIKQNKKAHESTTEKDSKDT